MSLENRIIKTLGLFALQSTALTLLELWRFLVRDSAELVTSMSGHGELIDVPIFDNRTESISNVYSALHTLVKSGEVVEDLGHYTIRANSELVKKRWLGYRYGVWREKRIRAFTKGLPYIPFVRGVALAGSQSLGLERKESDIDLFITTSPGWLWLPRTLITGYFQLLGIRRHGAYIENRVCLNHYVAGPKHMVQGRNWYTAIEYGKLRPLYGAGALSEFQSINKEWMAAFFPNFEMVRKNLIAASPIQKVLEAIISVLGGKFFERTLGSWQGQRIHKNEPHIIVAEDELSFHPQSKQDALLEAFR